MTRAAVVPDDRRRPDRRDAYDGSEKRFLLRLRPFGHARTWPLLSDGRYVAALQTINATMCNGVFAFGFFGAALFMILRSSFTFRGSGRAGSR